MFCYSIVIRIPKEQNFSNLQHYRPSSFSVTLLRDNQLLLVIELWLHKKELYAIVPVPDTPVEDFLFSF
jgi:hypothetical protein